MSRCNICHTLLDQPNDIGTKNCGGDCLLCMARLGDEDCIEELRKNAMTLKQFQKKIHDAIRKEKEENGNDVRGYKLLWVDFGLVDKVDFEFNHDQKTVTISD